MDQSQSSSVVIKSFRSSTPPSSVPVPIPQNSITKGRTMQRIHDLEEKNGLLNASVLKLTKWKSSLEKWIWEEFGVTIPGDDDVDNHGISLSTSRTSTTAVAASTIIVKTDTDHEGNDESKFNTSQSEREDSITSTNAPDSPPTPTISSTINGTSVSSVDPAKPHKAESGQAVAATAPAKCEASSQDDTPCDVCRDIYPEDHNEMIFCDKCNICVHQACYGIIDVPEGAWQCKACVAGIEPGTRECRFCPRRGGAMVPVKSPRKTDWAHTVCVMWIPGLTFHDPNRMDYAIGIPMIEKKRWHLLCVVCKKGLGTTCCVQCAYKRCTKAFHVTCAFGNTDFKMVWRDDNTGRPDGIILAPFCRMHKDQADMETSTGTPLKQSPQPEPDAQILRRKKPKLSSPPSTNLSS